jgi:hypothetical protein
MITEIFTISEGASVMVMIFIGLLFGCIGFYQTLINTYNQILTFFNKNESKKSKILLFPFFLLGVYYLIVLPQAVVKVISLIFA